MNVLWIYTILYPLIIPIWENGPIYSESIAMPEAPTYMDNKLVHTQQKRFKFIKDPRIRSTMVIPLSEANNPEAVKVLEEFLKYEEVDFVKADILKAIYKQKLVGPVNDENYLKQFFADKNDYIRGYSLALYLNKTSDVKTVIDAVSKEKSNFVIKLLLGELATLKEKLNVEALDKLLDSENYIIRADAAFIIASNQSSSKGLSSLNKVVKDPNDFVRIRIAEGLKSQKTAGDELIKILSEDSNPSARGFISQVPSKQERLPVFIKLSTDKDFEVRRTACLSLGNYKESDAVEALIVRLTDNVKAVRYAAAEALVQITPKRSYIDRIGKEILPKLPGRNAAVILLGKLDVKDYSDKINKMLPKVEDSESEIIFIEALRRLDYKASCSNICTKSSDEDFEVRKYVATALGQLKEKGGYETLVKLSSDTNSVVAREALNAMGVIADPYFSDILAKTIRNVKTASGDMRAAACWSLAKINKPDKTIYRQMMSICIRKIIPAEGGSVYDSNNSRISACLALVDYGKNYPEAKSNALKMIKTIQFPSGPDAMEMSSNTLKEYMRQIELYYKGEKVIGSKTIPFRSPVLSVRANVPK